MSAWEDIDGEPADAPSFLYGEEDADRHLRHLLAVKRRMDKVKRLVAVERARLDTYEAEQLLPLTTTKERLELDLAQYHRAVMARDGRKTIELPNGVLRARAQQPRYEFDPEQFIPWAQENAAEMVRYPDPPAPEVNVNAVKGAVAIQDDRDYAVDNVTGERIPGLTVTFRDPKHTIEVKP